MKQGRFVGAFLAFVVLLTSENLVASSLEGTNAPDLLAKSLLSQSKEEKTIIRSYIATQFPGTVEAAISNAWLSDAEGKEVDALAYYREALRLDPKNLLALDNIASVYGALKKIPEKIASYESALAIDPSFLGYNLIYLTYFAYRDDLKDGDKAKTFRRQWESKLGANHFAFAAIDSWELRESGRYQDAYTLRHGYVEQGNLPWWFLEKHGDQTLQDANRLSMNTQSQVQEMTSIIKIADSDFTLQEKADAYAWTARQLHERFNSDRDAAAFYLSAYAIYPTAEVADALVSGIYQNAINGIRPGFWDSLTELLPDSSSARASLAFVLERYNLDPQGASEMADQAIAMASTLSYRRAAVAEKIDILENSGKFDDAFELISSDESFKGDSNRWERDRYSYYNRLLASDYTHAYPFLKDFNQRPDGSTTWNDDHERQLSAIIQKLAGAENTEPYSVTQAISDTAVFSPDGKLAASGTNPMELWDVARGVKLKDLGRGGFERTFSPDGKYLAAASNFTTGTGQAYYAVYVYDVSTGRLVHVHSDLFEIGRPAFSPDAAHYAFMNAAGLVRVFSSETGHLDASFRVSDRSILGYVAWIDANRLAAGKAQENVVRIVDAFSGVILKTLPGVNWVHDLITSAGEKYLVCMDNTRQLTVWDTKTWVKRQTLVPMISKHMIRDPKSQRVFLNDHFESKYQYGLFDLDSMKMVCQTTGYPYAMAGFSGSSIVVAGNGAFIFLDPATLSEKSRVESSARVPNTGLVTNAREAWIATNDTEGYHFFSMETGKSLGIVADLSWLYVTKSFVDLEIDGQDIFARNGPRGRGSLLFHSEISPAMVADNGNQIVLAGFAPGLSTSRTVSNSTVLHIELRDIKSGKLQSAFTVPVLTGVLAYGTMYSPGIQDLGISPEGDAVAVVTNWMDGYGHEKTVSKIARLYTREGKVLSTVNGEGSILELVFSSAHPGEIGLKHGANFWNWYRRDTGVWESYGGQDSGLVTGGPEDRVLWDPSFFEYKSKRIYYPDSIKSIRISPERKLLIVHTWQNRLDFYKSDTLELQLRLYIRKNGEWISSTRDGKFDTSPGGLDKVFVNDASGWATTLSADQMFTRFFRPDVVADRLSGQNDVSAATPVTIEPPPSVFIEIERSDGRFRSSNIPTTQSPFKIIDGVVRIRVTGVDQGGGVTALRLFLNDKVVGENVRAIASPGSPPGGGNAGGQLQLAVTLSNGENKFSAIGYSRDQTSSIAATTSVPYTSSNGTASTLWILATGINEYKYPAYRLNYAVGDARAFVDSMRHAAGRVFQNVEALTLSDQEASRAGIIAALKSIAEKSRPEDVFIFYYAGHGVAMSGGTHGENEFYFLPQDAGRISKPEEISEYGISGADFRTFVSSIKAQKQFYILDACSSGTIAETFASHAEENAVTVLGRSTGAATAILAATQPNQLAQEFATLGHGVFTEAVVEGLQGDAADRKGLITVLTLISSIQRELPEITRKYAGTEQNVMPWYDFARFKDFPVGQVE